MLNKSVSFHTIDSHGSYYGNYHPEASIPPNRSVAYMVINQMCTQIFDEHKLKLQADQIKYNKQTKKLFNKEIKLFKNEIKELKKEIKDLKLKLRYENRETSNLKYELKLCKKQLKVINAQAKKTKESL